MNRKKYVLLFTVVIGLLLTFAACSNENDDTKEEEEVEKEKYEPEPNPEASQISTYNEERLDEQADIEAEILEEYNQDTYRLDDPFIKVDPYDSAPLTALVMFETEKPVQIHVSVGNEEGEIPIEKEWEDFKEQHEIPVLGLYPDRENIVSIVAIDEDGNTEISHITIETEPLPEEVPNTELVEGTPDDMERGLSFIAQNVGPVFAVDGNADVRWYSSLPGRLIFNPLSNGNYIQITKKPDADQYNDLLETDLLGKVYNAYEINIEEYERGNLIHHDVIEVPSGNLLATTHEPNGEYIEDFMHEIDRETGETTQEINVRELFPSEAYEEYDGKNADLNDWFHQNAIWYDESDNSILISGRSQDLIMKMSYPDAEIKWILAEDEEWPEDYEDYLLEPINDVKFPAGQHAMKILDRPEDQENDHIKNVILFDNNTIITRGNEDVNEDYSRAVLYEINEEDMTVEEIWSYGEERGEDFFSDIVGNVQYLYETDHVLLTSGAIEDETSPTGIAGRVVEVDTEDDANVIFEVKVTGRTENSEKFIYRSIRLPAYPEQGWDFTLSEREVE